MTKLINQISLLKVKGLGPVSVRRLITDFKTTDALFNATINDFKSKYTISGERLYYLIQQAKKEKQNSINEYNYCIKKNIKVNSFFCNGYPKNLKNCNDAPQILYSSGNLTLNKNPLISIVGTRTNSSYGDQVIKTIIAFLKNYDVTIVSGLAKGIDYLAHYYCVENNIPTVAILGHGLNYTYPKYHAEIALEIKKNGALITEFNPFIKPIKYNFPKRNRIIAGISNTTIVIESPEKGGAMITARIANSYNKDVFAVPGNINSNYSKGCHKLIFNNEAHLFENCESLIKMIGLQKKEDPFKKNENRKQKKIGLEKEEHELLNHLIYNPNYSFDYLSKKLNISIEQLQFFLTTLEIKGHIVQLFGKKIKIIT